MRQKNLKRIPLILACIVSFALVSLVQAPITVPVVSMDPPESIGDPGMYFGVNINVADVVDMYSWGMKIGWNRDLLECVDVTEGDFLMFQPEGTSFPKVIYSDYIDVGCSTLGDWPGVSGSGTLMTVTFLVLDAGRTALDIYDATLLDSLLVPIVHTDEDGYFETNAAAKVVGKSAWPEHHHFDISVQVVKDGDANQTLYGKITNVGALPLYAYVTFEIVRDNGIIDTPTSEVVTLGPGTQIVLSADYGPLSDLDAGKHYASASVWFSYTGTYWEQGIKIKTFSFAVVP